MEPISMSMSDARTPEEEQAHNEAMIAKADEGVSEIKTTTTQDGEKATTILTQGEIAAAEEAGARPEGIPEKFWDSTTNKVNVAAMLKAQQDAEAALRATHATDKKVEEKPAEDAPDAATEGQASAITTASEEFATSGELSEATFESLEKVGLSRDMVNEYIAGQQAIVAQIQTAAYSAFEGDPGKYDEAAQWAANNLTDDEIQAIDVQVQSTNPAIVKAGAEALQEKYAAGRDIDPEVTIQSGGNAPPTGKGFKSGAEMRAAMADPLYKSDPAFRAEVAKKIDVASKSGINLFA
jgi:hypothetical protein